MEKYNIIEIGDCFFVCSVATVVAVLILATNTFLLPSFSASFRIFAQTTASYLCVVDFVYKILFAIILPVAFFVAPPFLFHFM